ncbi:AP2 domain-containing protein [Enterocloster asparagiformis]|nr:AP2 domain-containing protein [Enterocloster asparagiformis]UWO77428.1 AP2 domain-containing protein [[Clostridium] asparagiforme DSM 15981]
MLRRGEVQSCGCLHDELFRENSKIAYKNSFVDGTNVPRIASTQTVQRNNTSGVTGVTWHKGTGKWRASISFKGKSYSLGYYTEIPLAAKARKTAEDELFGDFLKWYAEEYPENWKRIQKRQQKKHP